MATEVTGAHNVKARAAVRCNSTRMVFFMLIGTLVVAQFLLAAGSGRLEGNGMRVRNLYLQLE
jgi:hypothetical protein